MSYKIISYLALVACLGAVLSFLNPLSPSEKPEQSVDVEALGFSIQDLGTFTTSSYINATERKPSEERVVGKRNNDVLRVKVLHDQGSLEAQEYSRGQALLLEAQYDSRLPPYPEFLTNQTGCDERFIPEKHIARNGFFYTTFADERFNYGLCDNDLIHYRAGFGIFYCESSKRVFQIEYFTNKETSDTQALFDSFHCVES